MAKRIVVICAALLLVVASALFIFFLVEDAQVAPQAVITATPFMQPPAVLSQPTPLLAQPTAVPKTALPLAQPVRLVWFYRPPKNGDLASLAKYFDVYILTHLDEPVRDSLRAQNKGPFLLYLRADAIQDPGGCNIEPYQNQVAYKVGDFCEIERKHPDWFLRDANGSMISRIDPDDDTRYVRMDPGNPEWRAFFLERAQSLESLGWDGVFLDGVEASRAKFARRGAMPAKYPDDLQYQAAMQGFLEYLSVNYFRPKHRLLFANISEMGDNAIWFRYLASLDGAMQESFAVDWLDGYLSVTDWEAMAALIDKTQQLDKHVILVAQGKQADTRRELFAFASYLLVNSGRASFRYASSNAYSSLWLYPSYDIDLGAPLGPRYRVSNGWRRDFENGSVTIDLVSHSAEITLRR